MTEWQRGVQSVKSSGNDSHWLLNCTVSEQGDTGQCHKKWALDEAE